MTPPHSTPRANMPKTEKTIMMKPLPTLLAASAMAVFGIAAQAEEQRFAADYSIAFAGVPVAKSKFRTVLSGETLTMTGSMASSGLASVFAPTKATSEMKGRLTKNGVEPLSYAMSFTSGERKRATRISFKNGNAVETVLQPQRKPNPNAIPIEPGQLKNVIDPFFASMIAAASPGEVCGRTVRVYDGTTRMDLVLRANGTEKIAIKGYEGEGVRCSVRYVPVAGHRPSSSSIQYMAQGERASITFVPLAGSGIYAPAKATVKTKNGTVSIKATRLEPLQ
jgi:hypothetical protein